jgi:transcription initiation factor TFIIIB Brf1 subunit/transcription initiation factor TFIIB
MPYNSMSIQHKAAKKCPFCGSGDIITDYTAGDEICRSCASVVSERLVCDEAEWRAYENDDRGQREQARCGGKGDSGDALESSVMLGGKASLRKSLSRTHMSSSNISVDLKVAENTSQIHDLCTRLGLSQSVSVSYML